MSESPKQTVTLIGQFFHNYTHLGAVRNQGYVLSSPEPGYYLCQLFEWFMGEPSCRKLVHITDMMDWAFYPSAEHMNDVYEHHKRYPGTMRTPDADSSEGARHEN